MEIMTIYSDSCHTGTKTHFCNNTHFPVDTWLVMWCVPNYMWQ